ncbi:acyl-CoA dehydrogenase family protein, partial [Streptomyces canus]|uniref:acyl-CoA dehydrogenase family protein n=1 Tax=Streptomyces canus TaxID=58343 RepID=UPI00368A83E8
MDARFTAEQDGIRLALRELLRRRCGPGESRSAADTPAGYDPELWTALAQQLGLPGLALPERYGGVGCSATELALACEETGRVLAATPLLGTSVLVAPLVQALGTDAQRADLLPRIASGSLTATLAVPPGTALALTDDNRGDWAGGGRAGGVQARPVRSPDGSTAPGPRPTGRPTAPTGERPTTAPLAGTARGGPGAASAGQPAAVAGERGPGASLEGAAPGGLGAASAEQSAAPSAGTARGGPGAASAGQPAAVAGERGPGASLEGAA